MFDQEKTPAIRKNEYLQKLRDPRWQKKRLEVMQRDEFTCQICFDSTQTLNVHHNYYRPGADPWEYELEALVTLCEYCHEEETNNRREEEQALLEVLRRIGFKAGNINTLMSSLYSAFGDCPQFQDRDEYLLTSVIQHFYTLGSKLDELVAAKRLEIRQSRAAEEAKK